jgi:hypothetical protein
MCPKAEIDRGPWIATHSGARFYIAEMNLCEIPMEDIAHALSMNCRYNGHVDVHYSVAEHCVAVAKIAWMRGLSDQDILAALLHDLSEAFVPDIPRPFKGVIAGFQEYEDELLIEAGIEYGFYYPFHDVIHEIDRSIVRSEATRLFPNPPDWVGDYEVMLEAEAYFDRAGIGVPAEVAKREFLAAYEELRRDGWMTG